MRQRGRIDGTHAAIVKVLRRTGWQVLSLADLGNGAPDLLIQRGSIWRLVEVKTPRGRLTAAQQRFHAEWPVTVVRSVDEALGL
jgi:hypothetical protein